LLKLFDLSSKQSDKNHLMKIKESQKSAAGLKAVFYSMRMALKSMSPLKIWRVLIPLNQKDGTDCPGCAWPDPDNRSNLGGFVKTE
jgi:hypothetical protein